jgi:hypothetical protein
MSKPDDIPRDVWDAARRALSLNFTVPISGVEVCIAAARAIQAERARWQPAVTYFQHYCQDEADDVENCVCGQEQHIAAKNFRDAIRNPSPAADPPRGDNISPSPLGAAGNDDFKRVQVIGSIE